MRFVFFRITPSRTLTLNNRWWKNVHPKKTLFFLPVNYNQLELWKDFLCVSHKRSFVYLHEVHVECSNYRYRRLTFYKKQPLYEVLVKQWNFYHAESRKVLKVFRGLKINIKFFPSKKQLIPNVDENGKLIKFNTRNARKQDQKNRIA